MVETRHVMTQLFWRVWRVWIRPSLSYVLFCVVGIMQLSSTCRTVAKRICITLYNSNLTNYPVLAAFLAAVMQHVFGSGTCKAKVACEEELMQYKSLFERPALQ